MIAWHGGEKRGNAGRCTLVLMPRRNHPDTTLHLLGPTCRQKRSAVLDWRQRNLRAAGTELSERGMQTSATIPLLPNRNRTERYGAPAQLAATAGTQLSERRKSPKTTRQDRPNDGFDRFQQPLCKEEVEHPCCVVRGGVGACASDRTPSAEHGRCRGQHTHRTTSVQVRSQSNWQYMYVRVRQSVC